MGEPGRWGLRIGAVAGGVLVLLLIYALRLHPLVVMLVVLAAGQVLGVWGILFAVPTAAALRVLIPELWVLVQQKQVQA
jgi:predicted PurR-regulated permease PerM